MSNRVICVVNGDDEPDKDMIGRIIQYSYLERSKRDNFQALLILSFVSFARK